MGTTAPPSKEHTPKVPFVFGVLGADAIPGPILIRMLSHLGLTASAATTLLQRMRSHQMLSAEHVGRVAVYTMTGVFRERFDRLAGAAPAPWDGNFHTLIHEIPETRRRARQHLLQRATSLGFGQVRPGLWVSCWDRTAPLRAAAATEVPHDLVITGTLRVDWDSAYEIAERAFDLAAHSATMRASVSEIERRSEAHPTDGPDALAECWETASRAIPMLLLQSNLAVELLPAHWPGKQLGAALAAYYAGRIPALRQTLLDDLNAGAHAELMAYATNR